MQRRISRVNSWAGVYMVNNNCCYILSAPKYRSTPLWLLCATVYSSRNSYYMQKQTMAMKPSSYIEGSKFATIDNSKTSIVALSADMVVDLSCLFLFFAKVWIQKLFSRTSRIQYAKSCCYRFH